MRFITETDLKNSYRKQPFSTYFLNENERLTPEAKQFIADRKIKLENTQKNISEKAASSETQIALLPSENRLFARFDSLYADFLEAVLFANHYDPEISSQLIMLAEALCKIKENEPTELPYFPEDTPLPKFEKISLNQVFSQKGPWIVKLIQLYSKIEILYFDVRDDQKNQLKMMLQKMNDLILRVECNRDD